MRAAARPTGIAGLAGIGPRTIVAALALMSACAHAVPPATPAAPATRPAPARPAPAATIARAPLPATNPRLPAVPQVDDALRIRVVYPSENYFVPTADSNFIFGSVGNGTAGLRINGELVPVWPNGAFMGWVPNPPTDDQAYELVAYTLKDTVRLRYPVRTRAARAVVPPPEPTIPQPALRSYAATLADDSLDRFASDTDNLIIARPTPAGTYRWFLFPGTRVRVVEYRGDMARVELDSRESVWVARRDLRTRGAAEPSLQSAAPAQASSSAEEVAIDTRLAAPPAYLVEEAERELSLTLYNVALPAGRIESNDPLISSINVSRDGARSVLRVTLVRPVYGYLVLYEKGLLRLAVRRPPAVDRAAPLRGMTVVIDPGHPPIGATGPTGLWEPVPTLAVGLKLQKLLQAAGANVVMTRVGPGPVDLGARPVIGRRADANVLVSIHLNANPDGQNPFRDNGTATYYFQPHSKLLATIIDGALVPELGLHNRGVFFQNLAVCRPTWFPSALAEGLFIIMPDQEAAIRTPEYQDAYALGLLNGLTQYFASFAQ